MNEEQLLADLIIKERLSWMQAEKLLRAFAWLSKGPSYLKEFKGPAMMDCLVLRREPSETTFEFATRH